MHSQKPVDILLLGTIHFTPSPEDTYSNQPYVGDSLLYTQQLEEVIDKLVEYRPNKICIEATRDDQVRINNDYTNYLNGSYTLRMKEREQIGFTLARRLGIPALHCVSHSGRFDDETVLAQAVEAGQKTLIDELHAEAQAFMRLVDKYQRKRTLRELLVFLNSESSLQKNLALYLNYLSRIMYNEQYAGAQLVADWYATNLFIYANILQIIGADDKNIIVIMGQGHIPVLKHFFANNPAFRVIPVRKVLG